MDDISGKRILAVGDIHGCYKALTALADAVSFGADDLVVTVGDYIDRGPDSSKVLDWLIERYASGGLVPILGNHEEMMIAANDDSGSRGRWLEFGGAETLMSYGVKRDLESVDLRQVVPSEHWQFIERDCRDYFETDSHFFVHGNAAPDVPLADQDRQDLRWRRFHGTLPHQSGKTMVCGHTPQTTGYPNFLGWAVCIDTGVYAPTGWLTCLDVKTGDYWQANEKGTIYKNNLFGKFSENLESLLF